MIMTNTNCKTCELWSEYKEDDDVDNSSREPNNCSTWLCNGGKCPLDYSDVYLGRNKIEHESL